MFLVCIFLLIVILEKECSMTTKRRLEPEVCRNRFKRSLTIITFQKNPKSLFTWRDCFCT